MTVKRHGADPTYICTAAARHQQASQQGRINAFPLYLTDTSGNTYSGWVVSDSVAANIPGLPHVSTASAAHLRAASRAFAPCDLMLTTYYNGHRTIITGAAGLDVPKAKQPAQTTAGRADVLWDNRASAASALPSDADHPGSRFVPVLTCNVTVQRDGHTINVIPGVLTSGDHAYPACIADPEPLSKLPDFTDAFDDFATAEGGDIMDYCAEPFEIAGNMTTRTDPATRTTYITGITDMH
ncbi:hypothetical protein GPECTOR_725g883 [Gonium pectorale]|uniref:Uncharacterized protein n=1 Tax=Gonium pectorale TaxID=33097 RepID=A0A150FU56_GONPE|nr:hypothetical protein GPECTOR_725g883 [Gonium pectorale]|eukprot:KXZ41144.1 hypothetical protein GPECTOR_725g883 [Gonium pectorale]